MTTDLTLSIVIPSYQRGSVLIDTLRYLFAQNQHFVEIIVVDQTQYGVDDPIAQQLEQWQTQGQIKWLRRRQASIPAAMNVGLLEASSDLVLFLDDDIIPNENLCASHITQLSSSNAIASVGQIRQPNQVTQATEQPQSSSSLSEDLEFTFNGAEPANIKNCMAGNLCVRRLEAIDCGGFDERFTGVAYRFETEFIRRFLRQSNQVNNTANSTSARATPERELQAVKYTPGACIDHLQSPSGGTRSHSQDHLRQPKVSDSIGDYYFAYRESTGLECWRYCFARFIRSMRTRFYFTHPWYLPKKMLSECGGWLAAKRMAKLPPKLLQAGQRPKIKFAAVISHPIQHYAPLFRALNQLDDIEVHIVYLCDLGTKQDLDQGFGVTIKWDVPLLDGYDYTVLKTNFVPKRFGFWEMSSANIGQALNSFAPDFIWLHGYSQKFIWDTLFWAQGRAKTIHFADSELLHDRRWYNRIIKNIALRFFFSQCDLFMSVGDNNEAYYRYYGVPTGKLFRGACPVDIKRLTTAREREISNANSTLEPKVKPESIYDLRKSLGIAEDAFVILFSGKLVDYKRPLDLVHALVKLPSKAHVLFLGEGAQRVRVEKLAQQLKVETQITITGFVNQSELHRYMMLADVLAVTSERDAHPLVVTEGLAFGLPVVASNKVGCVGASDTARPNENALIYSVADTTELASMIEQLMNDNDLRKRMSDTSFSMAQSQSAETVAKILFNTISGPLPLKPLSLKQKFDSHCDSGESCY